MVGYRTIDPSGSPSAHHAKQICFTIISIEVGRHKLHPYESGLYSYIVVARNKFFAGSSLHTLAPTISTLVSKPAGSTSIGLAYLHTKQREVQYQRRTKNGYDRNPITEREEWVRYCWQPRNA